MSELTSTTFGYQYLPGVAQYSAGVVAAAGYQLTRVEFATPIPLAHGLRRAAEITRHAGQPPQALCACELRSPEPFSEAGFASFNQLYLHELHAAGVWLEGANPIARTNVCPVPTSCAEPAVHAFSFASPAAPGEPGGSDFVVSGSAEAPEGRRNYRDHVIASGDVSTAGLQQKAEFVVAEMRRRMAGLGAAGTAAHVAQVYCVYDIRTVLAEQVASPQAIAIGVNWLMAKPPVLALEYEMDCRTVSRGRLASVA